MFDIPEIIEALLRSGASQEVVEKVQAYFDNRLGDILEDMAREFGEYDESIEYSSETFTEQHLTTVPLRRAKIEESNNGKYNKSI